MSQGTVAAEMYREARTELFATMQHGLWHHIYPSPRALTVVCGVKAEDVRRVRVTFDENPERNKQERPGNYWAWWDSKDEHFTMVWPSRLQVEMCFPYGSDAEEKRGRGKLVPVKIEEVGDGKS